MAFDYRKEYARFINEWERQAQIMRTEGMSEEAIAELYNLYHAQFKADRNYALHKYDYAQSDNETASTDGKAKKQGMIMPPIEFEQCFDLIQQIDNPQLINALKRLKPSDYALLCMVVVDGLSGADIALKTGQTPSSVSQKLARIKKFLKNFL